MEQNKEIPFYILSNNTTTFLVFRDLKFNQSDININPENKKEFLTLVFDLENLTKELDKNIENSYTFEEIINNNTKNIDNEHLNIVIKNSLVGKSNSLYAEKDLILNELHISDELYSMSPNINTLFEKFKPKKLVLKKFKINSKNQLNTFLEFIFNTGCEELELEDIFVELIIKKDKNDETFNELDQFISFENGKFYINNKDEQKETKLKKVKMIDCPLFALSDETFKDINNYKDISLEIDENSLLNPNIITKFKISEGYSDICFDLDSYKLSDEKNEEKDNLELLNDIFNIIIDNKDNNCFKKICFKNFDMTKYEYITGENITFIKEKNWILNKEEKERKEKFEQYDENINKKIKDNLNKLSNIKELLFNNCSNYFIDLILKFINNNYAVDSNYQLNYLKLKKCGKEHFELKNIISLKIKNFILFDTPLAIEELEFPTDEELGHFENFTIKIASLEHYCKVNNLNYYKTIEIIVDNLITKENLYNNLTLEMNTLPVIMTFLVARKYNKILKNELCCIPPYFQFIPYFKESEDPKKKFELIKEGIQYRDKLVNESFILNGIKNNNIILKKNNIKNKLETFEFYYFFAINFERHKFLKIDFGKDIFNLDVDYRAFIILNKLDNIVFENCLFSNYINPKLKPEQISETIINLIRETKKNYKLDIKSLNEIIYKNKSAEDITFILKYLSLEEGQQISGDIIEYFKNLQLFFDNLKYLFGRFVKYMNKLTIILNNIKERKQFYCLLCLLGIIIKEQNITKMKFKYHEKEMVFKLPSQEKIKEKIEKYFIKRKNENNKDVCSPTFNSYYTSDEENRLFGDFENKKEEIQFEIFKFKIEYKFDDQWDFIMK